jgi:hypothetical protein
MYNMGMRIGIALLVVGLSAPLFSADKDTVPLGKKTSAPRGETEDSILGKPRLGAKKPAKKSSATEELEPYVASVSVFGTSRLDDVKLKQFLGAELDAWIKKGLEGDESSIQMEEKLAKKVKEKYGFADANWSVIQFFEPEDLAIHITLDVVEKEDQATRMSFLPNPTEEFADPDKLIASWAEYEGTALQLIENNQLIPETEKCAAFHCPFGHNHEKLKKFEKIFVEGVKKNADKLATILQKDKRSEFRAASAYLLAYLKDGDKLVSLMLTRIKDSDPLVRNNVLRVLGDIAEFHQQHVIPVKPIVEALNFPRASDRSKAIYVAFLLSLNVQSARDEIRKTAIPNLLRLLAGKQPDSREFAHGILRKVSGKEYPATDMSAWTTWYSKQPKDRGVSQTK